MKKYRKVVDIVAEQGFLLELKDDSIIVQKWQIEKAMIFVDSNGVYFYRNIRIPRT